MNAQKFLEKFKYIANAPNGVVKLRELILSLAMQGKLVRQDSKDVAAIFLIKEIEAEKRRLVKEQKIKPPPRLLEIKEEEKRYSLPDSWKWIRFGNIAQHNSGKTLDKRRNTGHPRDYITTSNLYWGTFELGELRQMLIRDEELEKCTARKGDLLICEGGEAGRAAVWPYDYEVSFQNHIHRCRFYYGIDPYYAYRFFEKLNATGEINQHRKGVGISNMSGKALASIVFPFPPFEEQKRIVAKVDELMALCDKLEVQQQNRDRQFPVLSRASHGRFAESPTMANLKAIFDETEIISPVDLRKTILNLAFQGKLVPQDSNDEPVDSLLSMMEKIRADLIKNRQLRITKRKELSNWHSIIQRQIPESWRLMRLEDICRGISDGVHKKPIYTPAGIPFVTVKNLTAGQGISFDSLNYISEADHREFIKRTHPERGDLLVTKDGTIGVVRIIDTDREFSIFVSVALVKPLIVEMNRLILRAFESSIVQDQIIPKGAALKHLHLIDLRNLLIPIPPLSEQKRIVAKVDELMDRVAHLEEQQKRKIEIAEFFAQSVVTSITGTQIKEPEKMKAPKTELITKLQVENKPRPADKSPLANLITKHKGELSAKALWQQSGLAIDVFYQQLKTEMANGWINEPEKAVMKEVEVD